MSEAVIQLPMRWGEHGGVGTRARDARREARVAGVRMVEYCPYPRASAARGWRVGFARDRSATGICLEADGWFPVGSLLRLTVRGIDGRPTLDALGRVAWCREEAGRVRVGVALLQRGPAPERTLARVRPVGATPRLAAVPRPA